MQQVYCTVREQRNNRSIIKKAPRVSIKNREGFQIISASMANIAKYLHTQKHSKKIAIRVKKTCKIICRIKIKRYLCSVNKKQTDLPDCKEQ